MGFCSFIFVDVNVANELKHSAGRRGSCFVALCGNGPGCARACQMEMLKGVSACSVNPRGGAFSLSDEGLLLANGLRLCDGV